MSRILRRPMFRGGPVDSRGTGITTGLDQPRIGAKRGRFFGDTGNVFTSGLALEPRGSFSSFAPVSFTPRVSRRGRNINPPLPTNEYAGLETMTDAFPGGTYNFEQEDELINVGDVELGLPKSKVEDLTKTEEVETPKKDDDEPEVTMTDLEKALGLDKARQEYAGDALAAASKAFFEGRGFEAIADAAAVKSKAPDIKRLAGLEEFKAKKASELYDKKLDAEARLKQGTMGALQKDIKFLRGLTGADRIAALGKLGYKAPSLSAAIKELKITGQAPDPATIKSLAELYIGPDFMGTVDVTENLTNKEAGTYLTVDGTALIIIDEKGSKPRLQKL